MKRLFQLFRDLWRATAHEIDATPASTTHAVDATRTSTTHEEVATPASYFVRLPLELIYSITALLLPEDAAALSLSCKDLSVSLSGPQLLQSLSNTQQEDLLLRLERDLGASHFFCSYCSKLHEFRKLPRCTNRRPFDMSSCVGRYFSLNLTPFWFAYYTWPASHESPFLRSTIRATAR